jgi:phosphonate transport system permease protein
MLGRIWADLLDSVDEDLVSALETSGASKLQTFIYVYIPVALPDMLSYTMYRLECGIRSSSVMGFIGLGGLGYQIQLALDDLAYNEVWTYLYLLIIMVTMIDLWSKGLRRRLHHDL